MRKAMAVGVVFLAACVVFAATLLAQSQSKNRVPDTEAAQAKALAAQITPLNMKTGLWQTTTTGKSSQMGAVSPINEKHCVTAKDLSGKEWISQMMRGKCSSVTVLKSTATDLEAQGKGCQAGHGMTVDIHAKFHLLDSEHSTGSMDMTINGFGANGSTVKSHADTTSKWIGATCPADMN